jgi:hypothetical protein
VWNFYTHLTNPFVFCRSLPKIELMTSACTKQTRILYSLKVWQSDIVRVSCVCVLYRWKWEFCLFVLFCIYFFYTSRCAKNSKWVCVCLNRDFFISLNSFKLVPLLQKIDIKMGDHIGWAASTKQWFGLVHRTLIS